VWIYIQRTQRGLKEPRVSESPKKGEGTGNERNQIIHIQEKSFLIVYGCSSLIVVSVAQIRIEGVEEIADPEVGADSVHGNDGVEGDGPSVDVVAVDGRDARGLLVLPDTEVAVDEAVVEPEDGVTNRGVDVRHDGADTIVAPCVGAALGAGRHVGESVAVLACVYHGRACVLRLGGVAISGEAVGLVAGTGTDVEDLVGEYLLEYVVRGLNGSERATKLTPLVTHLPWIPTAPK